jgi:fido (protein-threonine AMPylation protein)
VPESSELLAKDWVSFEFSYSLDMRRLIPHIVAIEEYKAAALSRVLPPDWLEASDDLAPHRAVDQTTVPEDAPAEEAPQPPELPNGQQPQEHPATTVRKQLPSRATSTAAAWIKRRFVPGSPPLSFADILSIHQMVAEQSGIEGGSAGALRTVGAAVGRTLVGGIHLGAPVERLPLLMDQYLQFIDGPELRSLPPVIHALLAHFFFDTIHPFRDANGRTARLIAAAILSQHGYNVHGTYALIRYFYLHDVRYHTILHRAWKRCPFEVTPFVAFGMEGFVMELKSVDSFIKMKLNRIVDRELLATAFRGRIGARARMLN